MFKNFTKNHMNFFNLIFYNYRDKTKISNSNNIWGSQKQRGIISDKIETKTKLSAQAILK